MPAGIVGSFRAECGDDACCSSSCSVMPVPPSWLSSDASPSADAMAVASALDERRCCRSRDCNRAKANGGGRHHQHGSNMRACVCVCLCVCLCPCCFACTWRRRRVFSFSSSCSRCAAPSSCSFSPVTALRNKTRVPPGCHAMTSTVHPYNPLHTQHTQHTIHNTHNTHNTHTTHNTQHTHRWILLT